MMYCNPKKNLKLVNELGPCWKQTFVHGHLKEKVEHDYKALV